MTPEGQIEHLKNKGVRFELISEADAIEYLKLNNNYFKLRAYRKNFEKHPDGKHKGQYLNLDFAMLKDLAIIDMRLRYTLLQLALDIEHFEKVKLLEVVSESREDGYKIVDDYILHLVDQQINDPGNYRPRDMLKNELERNKSSNYCNGLIAKYPSDFPIWVFVEIISFGRFIDFLGFAADYLNNKDLKDDHYLLKSVKSIRNAAAHNNCLINDLSVGTTKLRANYKLKRALAGTGIASDIRNKRLSNHAILDITTLLYVHQRIVTSNGVIKAQAEALHKIIDRCFKHIDYYKDNRLILSTFDFLKKIVDKFYPL